jgi:hypothetical protein
MADPLKFITEVDIKARGLSKDSVRRNFDALDDLRMENARLRQELTDVRNELELLRVRNESLKAQSSTTPKTPASVPKQEPVQEAPAKDDTELRFSMLELD